MSYAGYCEVCKVPYYEVDAAMHAHQEPSQLNKEIRSVFAPQMEELQRQIEIANSPLKTGVSAGVEAPKKVNLEDFDCGGCGDGGCIQCCPSNFTDKALIEEMQSLLEALKTAGAWQTMGIIEVALRNPNVNSYVEHWEARCLRAEKLLEEIVARPEQPKGAEQCRTDLSTNVDSVISAGPHDSSKAGQPAPNAQRKLEPKGIEAAAGLIAKMCAAWLHNPARGIIDIEREVKAILSRHLQVPRNPITGNPEGTE